MTDCPNGLIRDQLPEYVHGVLAADAAARIDAHLDGCEDCRAEVALLGKARAAMALFTPKMDVASIAAALPAPRVAAPRVAAPRVAAPRVAAPRVAARRAPRRFAVSGVWQYAAAAALVLAVGSSALWLSAPERSAQRVADSSSTATVPGTAAALPMNAAVVAQSENGMTFGGGLSDMSLDDLQSLLGQMDSVRTLPSSDPSSMTPVLTVNEGGKSL